MRDQNIKTEKPKRNMDAAIKSEKLSEVYDKIWNTYKYLETCEEPTNSDNVQVNGHKAQLEIVDVM